MKTRIPLLAVFILTLLLTACAPRATQPLTELPVSVPNTPAPTASATTNPYLLYDEFDNPNNGWAVFGDTANGEVGYAPGAFRLAFYQAGYFNSSYSRGSFSDFIVETRVCTSPTPPGIGAGLTLRASNNQWYLFWVYPVSREFVFLKGASDPVTGYYQETSLIARSASDLIQPFSSGDKLCLLIKAAAHGDSFDLWVAGENEVYQLLGSASDAEMASGYLGPSADAPKSNFSPAPVEALFEWIKVSPYSD
jgi:hypothetical protein